MTLRWYPAVYSWTWHLADDTDTRYRLPAGVFLMSICDRPVWDRPASTDLITRCPHCQRIGR